MIRQAHTYLVSAMSGATLIAIAIAAFVVLVSAQVFSDWPIAALGGNDRAAVSEARPVAGGDGSAAEPVSAAVAAGSVARRDRPAGDGRSTGRAGEEAAKVGSGTQSPGVATTPAGSTGSTDTGATAGGGSSPAASGGGASQPSSPTSTSAPASQSGGGGGSASGGSSGGSGGSGGGGSAGGGGGSPTTSGGSGSGGETSTAGALTETVNGTVATVDEKALGGALGSTGVTGVTEGVVNGVVGPESPVGKAVDETVKAVGGLLGGGR